MVTLLLCLLAGLVVVIALAYVGLHAPQSRATAREAHLLRALDHADARVEQDAHAAKQAMNDAAGQSWRNLAG